MRTVVIIFSICLLTLTACAPNTSALAPTSGITVDQAVGQAASEITSDLQALLRK
jgi:hypothetical protein